MKTSTIYSALAGTCGSIGAISGKLAFDSEISGIVAISSLLIFILANIFMWAAYTTALGMAKSTSEPLVINMACNFAITGLLGYLIFNEQHSLTWWTLLIILISGLALFLSPSSGNPEKKKN